MQDFIVVYEKAICAGIIAVGVLAISINLIIESTQTYLSSMMALSVSKKKDLLEKASLKSAFATSAWLFFGFMVLMTAALAEEVTGKNNIFTLQSLGDWLLCSVYAGSILLSGYYVTQFPIVFAKKKYNRLMKRDRV